MGIYLPNMEMPKDCLHCPFSYMSSDCLKIWIICKVKDVSVSDGDAVQEGRPDWCPLVEIPPHGRLIDADDILRRAETFKRIAKLVDETIVFPPEAIKHAPTIIEAEEET